VAVVSPRFQANTSRGAVLRRTIGSSIALVPPVTPNNASPPKRRSNVVHHPQQDNNSVHPPLIISQTQRRDSKRSACNGIVSTYQPHREASWIAIDQELVVHTSQFIELRPNILPSVSTHRVTQPNSPIENFDRTTLPFAAMIRDSCTEQSSTLK